MRRFVAWATESKAGVFLLALLVVLLYVFLQPPMVLAETSKAVRVSRLTNQSIPNTTWVAVSFTDEEYDPAGMHNGTNPDRLTAPVTGLYQVSCSGVFAGQAGGDYRVAVVTKNGGSPAIGAIGGGADGGGLSGASITGNPPRMSVSSSVVLTAGDYVQCWVVQNSGGALNLITQNNGLVAQAPLFTLGLIGADAASIEPSGLSGSDSDKLTVISWGSVFACGLLLIVILGPEWSRAWRFWS